MKYLSLVLSRTPSAWGVAVGNSKNYFQRHLHSPAHPHKVCQGLEIRPAAGQTPALQGAQDLEAVAENCRHNLPVKPGVLDRSEAMALMVIFLSYSHGVMDYWSIGKHLT